MEETSELGNYLPLSFKTPNTAIGGSRSRTTTPPNVSILTLPSKSARC